MKITIFTNIKDENRYLEQWIEYHHSIGVDEFILFEDYGSESHSEICDKYDFVTLLNIDAAIKEYPYTKVIQDKAAFYYVMKHFTTDYLIKLDPDEYISVSERTKDINGVLEFYNYPPSLTLIWEPYGNNGLIESPKEYKYDIVSTYTKCYDGPRVVTIGKTNDFVPYDFKSLTSFGLCKSDLGHIEHMRVPHFLSMAPFAIVGDIFIKHYVTKSYEEWLDRIFKRGEYHLQWYRKYEDFFKWNKDMLPLKDELEKKYNVSEKISKYNGLYFKSGKKKLALLMADRFNDFNASYSYFNEHYSYSEYDAIAVTDEEKYYDDNIETIIAHIEELRIKYGNKKDINELLLSFVSDHFGERYEKVIIIDGDKEYENKMGSTSSLLP